jgi:hypothetical protein
VNTTAQFNAAEIMRRAWEIFRRDYNYPAIPFHRIGRHCFASCLRMAWFEAKRAAAAAAIPADVRAARLVSLRAAADATVTVENWRQGSARRAEIESQIRQIV